MLLVTYVREEPDALAPRDKEQEAYETAPMACERETFDLVGALAPISKGVQEPDVARMPCLRGERDCLRLWSNG